MELALVLIATTLMLGMLSPLAFAVFLLLRDREDGTAEPTDEA